MALENAELFCVLFCEKLALLFHEFKRSQIIFKVKHLIEIYAQL